MGKIQKMSPKLANLISAGEVVERPSSVVKELVENSIDANSKTIKIYLKNGGIDEIKIVDDGDGMDEEDVNLAFLPHATSKIKNEYDLFRIKTLGFRGEAIASIAMVSEMNIQSSTDGINAYSLTYKNGVREKGEVINHNKGTTITVKKLFYNTPARLKYLKSDKTELSSIIFYINRIALSHPELKFILYSDDKQVINTTGSNNFITLVAEIYGIDAAKNVLTHDYISDGYKVKLVLIKPVIYRSNKLDVTLICNGRFIKNYNIINAIIKGYETYIPINKYPIAIMYLNIDPMLIDVNVHPAKTEIKISIEDSLCNTLTNEVKDVLSNVKNIATRHLEEKKAYQKQSIFDNLSFNENVESSYVSAPSIKEFEYRPINKIKKEETIIEESNDKKTIEIIKDATIIKEENTKKIPYMEYVATIFATYLIFQNEEGMYLVDQHAANERINYEYYYSLLSKSYEIVDLLIPISLTFTKDEALYIIDKNQEFEKIGFYLDQVGDRDFLVRRVPHFIKLDDVSDMIHDIISNMILNNKIDIMYFRDKIAKQISCKASIKANHQISKEEVYELMKRLNECKNPYTCPHGRPTIIKLTVSDIEKMFERIQS